MINKYFVGEYKHGNVIPIGWANELSDAKSIANRHKQRVFKIVEVIDDTDNKPEISDPTISNTVHNDNTGVLLGRMNWIEASNQWHLETQIGKDEWLMVQEFYQCPSLATYFKGLDKLVPKKCTIVIQMED